MSNILRDAIVKVLERFEREYQDLTDGQFGSVEDFPEVKRLRLLLTTTEQGERTSHLTAKENGATVVTIPPVRPKKATKDSYTRQLSENENANQTWTTSTNQTGE